MKYDPRLNGGAGYDMNDWNNSGSSPSSRYGEDDASSVTHARRPRRSRLDNEIPQPRAPMIIQPARPSSRKSKPGNGSMNMNMNNGGFRGHNSTFNGYEYQRAHYNSSRGPNESFSQVYPPSRHLSGYAHEYAMNRSSSGLIPKQMREPRKPRSIAGEKFTNVTVRSDFRGYESGELSTSDEQKRSEESEDNEEEEEEEEMRNLYMEARRAQGSKSVPNNMSSQKWPEENEFYYVGLVNLDSEIVECILQTMPPPEEYYRLKPIERAAYLYYCSIWKKPVKDISAFYRTFNREFYNYLCNKDSKKVAFEKICKSMEIQYNERQKELALLAYEKARKEAEEAEKLDFNQHRLDDPLERRVAIPKLEEFENNGPLHYQSCLQFATIGVGGKIVIIRPAGTVDPASGHVLSTNKVQVDDLKSLLYADEHSGKVIESVQNFKGPLIAGQTPTHSVRLYIQRQIDVLRSLRNSGDVKKCEVVDALLIWQFLEIMVQQHGRVSGPDIATLLTNASEELSEKTGISEPEAPEVSQKVAKERFNKFLQGGHINEAVESAITDGLYADAMTLVRRLHPNDPSKIEEIETRFMQLRAIEDPFATFVAVASGQPAPILTNTAFDDDNNWKKHAAIVLANLASQDAMGMVYNLGLQLARREKHCAADFCLLVVCLLAGYDPFIPLAHIEGEDRSRKHITLVHSGSHLLNRVDGLSGAAGFSFTDLHATDIFDYAFRLGNSQVDSPLAKSIDYQCARISYAKKLSSYGGFATDAFRYCTEVAKSMWGYIATFDKNVLSDLCDLADSLQYVAAATPSEVEWISSLRMMLSGTPPVQEVQQLSQQAAPLEDYSLTSEAQKWHDDHQAPLEIANKVIQHNPPQPSVIQQPPPPAPLPSKPPKELLPPTEVSSESSIESSTSEETLSFATASVSASSTSTVRPDLNISKPPVHIPKKIIEEPIVPKPPLSKLPEMKPPVVSQHPPSQPPPQPQYTPPISTPISIGKQKVDDDFCKSPRSELEELWGAAPPTMSIPPVPVMKPNPPPQPPAASAPVIKQPIPNGQPSVPNTKTTAPPAPSQPAEAPKNDRKASRGWFGSIKEKVIKSIPSANQMILPDDSKPSIVWDPVKQKYVGAGVEEEVVAAPPPVMSAPHLMGGLEGPDSKKSSTNSLRSARSGVGSRYLQSGMAMSQSPTMDSGMPSMMPPTMMPLPTSFSFMPAATDDDSSGYVDPFSGESNPTAESSESNPGAIPQ